MGLAGTLTCLYGDISQHYALNLGYCFSVGWDMVCRLVFCYTLLIYFFGKILELSKIVFEENYLLMSVTCIEISVFFLFFFK